MNRSVRLVLLSVTLFFVLFPLAAGRPGQPPTLKADEPAYFLMALSLVEDGDLLAEEKDLWRLFDHYPYLPVDNLILMSPDGWETTYFGKPYVFSLFAAPAAALFGVNGIFAFNLLLLMAMVWMGTAYLREFNSDAIAALFSAAFFLLSPAFAYAFWIHPEIFNMFSVAACLHLAFHRPREGEAREVASGAWERLRGLALSPTARLLGSGAVLALGVYNKPTLAAAGLPALFLVFRRRGVKGAAAWIAAAAVALATIAGISAGFTGKPSAYLGVDRGGVKVVDPGDYGEMIDEIRLHTDKHADESANSWQWIFRFPEIQPRKIFEDVGYFLVGRHTGLVPYLPFAVIALALFLVHGRRSPERWVTLGSIALVAVFFLLWIPFNWHGGGGFIGNRYFVNVYPAFLFLVTAIRPVWVTALGSGAAAVLLGSILFSPWGAPVWKPTLQAHVRGGLFPYFPLELSIRSRIPGYVHVGRAGVGFMGRKDVFKAQNASEGVMWIQGATRSEVWVFTRQPLESLMFQVRSPAPDNEIVLELPGGVERIEFENAKWPHERRRIVQLTPGEPTRRRSVDGKPELAYRMWVSSTAGRHPGNLLNALADPQFYLGAELTYLGTREQLEREEHYRISWPECSVPEEMAAGSYETVPVRVRNHGESEWPKAGILPVYLSYRWLSDTGKVVEVRRLRTALPRDVPRSKQARAEVVVQTPTEPGSYQLVLDAVREHVSWFSARGGATCEAPVTVVTSPEGPEADPPGAAE